MKNVFFYALALLSLALTSCEDQEQQQSCDDPVSFVYDVPFTLCQGNTAFWAENDEFSIVFKEVLSDSRCPSNADCVWAGRVDVEVRLNNLDQAATDTLAIGDISGSPNADVITFAGRTIRLLAVTPENLAGQTIPQNDYKVTLVVEE